MIKVTGVRFDLAHLFTELAKKNIERSYVSKNKTKRNIIKYDIIK